MGTEGGGTEGGGEYGVGNGERAEEVGGREGDECPLLGGGGLAGKVMGGRTGTPSPGRVTAGWPCGRLAIRLVALWKDVPSRTCMCTYD